MAPKWRLWTVMALIVAIAGCGGGHGARALRSARPQRTAGPLEPRPPSGSSIALQRKEDAVWKTDFSRHSVPLSDFASGGPPRDGIPPIDHPRPVGLAAGDRLLSPREPVIAVAAGGQARAYPEQILVWHEIVNDTLGGRPIAVTYCPLCNSALAFDRRVGGRTLTFGTTGKLRNSNLVMWDRQTQSWWQQFTGTALVGRYTGTQLRTIDAQVLSWQDFKTAYPHGSVLSRHTGFDRPYGENPYVGYDRGVPRFYEGRLDPRLPPMERVVAVFDGRQAVVVPFSALARHPVVAGTIAGRPLVVLYARGLTGARRGMVARSRDVGAAGVFDPRLGGRTLHFTATRDRTFRDETGTTWDLAGRAIAGPLRGHRVRALLHDEQFWFALAAFVPRARLLGVGSGR